MIKLALEQVHILYHRHQDCFFFYHLRWRRFLLSFLEQAQKRRPEWQWVVRLGFGFHREDTSRNEVLLPLKNFLGLLATLCPTAEVEEPKWSPKDLKVVENEGELGRKRRGTVESQIGRPLGTRLLWLRVRNVCLELWFFIQRRGLTSSVKCESHSFYGQILAKTGHSRLILSVFNHKNMNLSAYIHHFQC